MKTISNQFINYVVLVLVVSVLSGCSEYTQNRGFSLPKGDAGTGQLVFVEYRCIECHTLSGTEFSEEVENSEHETMVEIGGEVTRVKSYGDLVTSIINPSHKLAKGYLVKDITDQDGESKMRNYNEELNVRELIDLVAFLKSKYELKSVPQTVYPYYIPR